jgi:hypothetical protein
MEPSSGSDGFELRPDHDTGGETPVEEVRESEVPSSEPRDDKDAPSSTGKGEEKETLLEAVLKAVGKDLDETEEGDILAKGSPPSEKREQAEGEPKPDADLTEDDLKVQPDDTPKVQKRIKKLVEQRNAAAAERDALKGEADVTRTLRDFLVRNDIAREDFQLTLDLAAAMRRGDFNAFLTGVAPYVQLATNALGITLPNDLAQQVQQGRMTSDIAAQMSRDRYARALAEQEALRAGAMASNQAWATERADLQGSVQQTVDQWEAGVKAQDPDYARKEPLVRNLLWSVVNERGAPQTPQAAVEIAQEAYRRATETARSFMPPPRATQRTPGSSQRGVVGARSEPRSMMEAALQGLDRARRASP